jgi:hypothetical protein
MSIYLKISLSCFGLSLILAAIALVISFRQQKQSLKPGKHRFSNFLISAYTRILSVPLLKNLLKGIRNRLEIYSDSDEKILRKKAVSLLFITLIIYLSIISLFWIITRDWILLVPFMFLVTFIGDIVTDIFINNLQNRLLRQQIYYLEILRHKYYQQKSVEDANYEACDALNQKGSFEIFNQAEKINDILTSSDVESELERYYETAPNKYLKMLASILYITKEYGDTKVDNSSVFIRCTNYLASEIKAELYKREKLKYALKSLTGISIVPLFFLKPLREWASNSFAPLGNFYASKAGIILGMLTIIVSVVSYTVLRRLQRYDKTAKRGYINKTIEQKLYSLGLYRFADRLVPKRYTVKRSKMESLIKNAMAPLNLYTLYTRRILSGLAFFLVSLIFIAGLNAYTRYSILYLPQMPKGYLGGKLSEEEYEMLQNDADQDREIIFKIGDKYDYSTIYGEVIKQKKWDQDEARKATYRILDKIERLSRNIFWWWQLLICFVMFAAGYYAPILSLSFMARVRRIDMEEEVSQFQTIILMLMHMNRVHAEDILEWMEKFSVHFKEPLQKCLANFSAGLSEALEELKNDAAFPPMVSIIENLQLACEDLGVARAFEELENEMAFNREARKETNERIVEKRKNIGSILGFIPIYGLIIFYLIIPMIVSGMESISAFYRQLTQL